MVVLDEKMAPPPPYAPGSPAPPPFAGSSSRPATHISNLPANVLLQIIYMTFPQTAGVHEGPFERQRKTLYWLTYHLRLVNRAFYIACMHVLRSAYLPAYESLIRSPYSSDPFPMTSHVAGTTGTPMYTVQRETRVLDLFIALKTREDLYMDDSELHLGREELFKDLFDLMQPRSRLEDLVRHYGMREGVVHVTSPNTTRSPSSASLTDRSAKLRGQTSIPFSALSIAFSSRKVGLVLMSSGRKSTVVEVARDPKEKLEVAAKKLAKQLKVWLSHA
ncbi:hypothetical protein ID866_3673 [Astraeus odoratus]|nr:hypothetical protein ID866_3673 [Astraeus odoratus]